MADESEKLHGVWSIVALEVEGAAVSESAFNGSQIVMKDGRFTTISMGAEFGGTFIFDAASTPKTLDLLFTEGPHQGQSSLAIYELDADTLTICVGFAGSDRPREFATAPGRDHALEVLRRESRDAEHAAGTTAHLLETETPVSKGASASDPGSDEEMLRLEGEWTMISGEMDGRPLPDAFVATGRREFRGNEVTVTFGGQVFLNATVAVNALASPKAMDHSVLAGPNKGKQQLGIYELNGDTARLCFAPAGNARPSEFATTASDNHTLSTWRKAQR